MANKINTLSFLHDESIRHNNSRMEAVKRFYFTLSDYQDLSHYIEMNNSLSTDEHRAAFLCVLAKNIFLVGQECGSAFEIPIEKCSFGKKCYNGRKLYIKIVAEKNKKIISVSAKIYNSWDNAEIEYSFDCFSLASSIFIDEKTKGKTRITIDLAPEPGSNVDEFRSDKDIRFVIDILYKSLKLGM